MVTSNHMLGPSREVQASIRAELCPIWIHLTNDIRKWRRSTN